MNTPNNMRDAFVNKVLGCLLGGLAGDAMGAPVEGWTYPRIEKEHGWLNDFSGDGTDDSAIKAILCEAILAHNGHVTADEFADSFLKNKDANYHLFYIPVRNMLHRLEERLVLPVNAGWGNMQSSSSAMAISPMGIINACNPRQAARETFDVAGLVHAGETGFCRDGACAVAAAVAEALSPDATPDSVAAASFAYLHPASAAEMTGLIQRSLAWAKEAGNYAAFRERYYNSDALRPVMCDSRETVPAALALFWLARGDAAQAVECAANFGRDADTIATMSGAIAGAFSGVDALRPGWLEKFAQTGAMEKQKLLAARLVEICEGKARGQAAFLRAYTA